MQHTVFLIACTCCVLVMATLVAADNPIKCSTPSATSRDLPMLPKAYSIRLEVNELYENQTVEIHAFVDHRINKVALKVTSEEYEALSIFDFNTKLLLVTQPPKEDDIHNCNVLPIKGDELTVILKYLINYSKLPSLTLSDIRKNAKYIKPDVLDGEVVEIWELCGPSTDQYRKFTLYLTASTWTTASGKKNVPIRMTLSVYTNKDQKKYDYIIELSDYDPTPPDYGIFEVRKGTYCKGVKSTNKIREMTNAFSTGVEMINLGADYPIRINQYEYYDFKKNLFRLDYFEMNQNKFGYLAGPLSQIHDYTTDTAYLITQNEMKCEMKSIEELSKPNLEMDSTKNRLRNSQEMFHLDTTTYIYEGQRTIRGILCDVWIAHRTDYPLPNSSLSSWEWYFAANNTVMDIGERVETNFPVRLQILHDESATNTVLNFYNYDEDFQLYSSFDIDKCFGEDQRLDYSFEIIGSYDSVVNDDEETLKDEIRSNLFEIGKISPLRISNIQLEEGNENTVIVSFSLLGLPPNNKGDETDLQTAAKNLVDEISKGDLVILTGDNRKLKTKPDSYSKVVKIETPVEGRYSPGSMAGIGVGMLLVGCLIGYVIGKVVVKRRKEAAFQGMRFENVGN